MGPGEPSGQWSSEVTSSRGELQERRLVTELVRRRLAQVRGRAPLQVGVSGEGQDLSVAKIRARARPGTGPVSSEWFLELGLATGARPGQVGGQILRFYGLFREGPMGSGEPSGQ